MKFFMEKNKDEGHRVTIKIPKTNFNNAVVKEFIKIRKKTNINGFRKGKTPIKIIQEKYGDIVYYDVFKKLMQKFFYEFLHKEKIKIIGSPKYYMHNNENQKKEYFKCSVIYELYPEFQIKDIKNINAKKITVTITNEDVKKQIEKLKIKKNVWNRVNKSIKSYDRVTINYDVYEKNKKLEEFNKKNVSFIVSNNIFIPQLNYKIINHFVNDIIFFTIKFHSFHPEKKLQNKNITFKVKIIQIEQKQEFEENIKENNKEIKLNELHYNTIKNNINNQINNIIQTHLENQIIQKIIEKNIILIPPILFKEEIKFLYQQYKKQYKKNHHNILDKKYHINVALEAKRRLYIRIITQKIISNNKLLANEKNIQLLIKKISLNYKNPIEIINLYNKNENLKNAIKNVELEKQAMCFLKNSIKILEESWNFDKFINYNWNAHEELMI